VCWTIQNNLLSVKFLHLKYNPLLLFRGHRKTINENITVSETFNLAYCKKFSISTQFCRIHSLQSTGIQTGIKEAVQFEVTLQVTGKWFSLCGTINT